VRGGTVRVLRRGAAVGEGKITSLRRGREDVREVTAGMECGLVVDGIDDFAEGDVIESYTRERVG